jgi:FMN phosphatase YigB (HAD superfamily)
MFIYFDLGNVVAFFDREKSCRQMGAVAGIDAARVAEVVFDSPLNDRYERGEISSREFYDAFCSATGTKPEFNAMLYAKANIFQLNYTLLPLIAALEDGELRLGLLSNTSPCHWDFLSTRGYGELPHAFAVRALSYEVGALKPEPKIYRAAAELAGVPAREIFFIDDIVGHVAAARECGFDAVQYTTTPKLVTELRKRGLTFNF